MKLVIFALLMVIAGCTSSPKPHTYTNTLTVIGEAAAAAQKGIYGEYTIKIQAADKVRGVVYLNSELDYRDQRNLTVALHPKILAQLESKYGDAPQDFFVDKTISVKGYAKRVRINFVLPDGQATNKYYYQTHIRINNLSAIALI